jgi:peptide/nickel transport system permease protein
MLAFVLTRALRVVLHLVAVSLLAFALVGAAPGGFLDDLRVDPRVSPETIDALTRDYGLDRPLVVRYGDWLRGAVRGHFGYSLTYRVPVERLLLPRLAATIWLTATALLLAWGLALVIGVGTTALMRGWSRRFVDAGVAAVLAVPELLLVMLLLVWALRAGWLAGAETPRLLVPMAVLACSAAPVLLHHVRRALADALPPTLDAALAARGLSPARRVSHHALRLAAPPLVALAGVSVGTLVSASLLVEVLVGWPGIGPLMLEAVLARDDYVVVAVSVASCALVLAGNALADAALVLVEPRVRGRV